MNLIKKHITFLLFIILISNNNYGQQLHKLAPHELISLQLIPVLHTDKFEQLQVQGLGFS